MTMSDQTYAIIDDGIVVNIVVWDGNTETWQPPEGSTAVEITAEQVVGVGYTYSAGQFEAPVSSD